jgi:hypothetical protein
MRIVFYISFCLLVLCSLALGLIRRWCNPFPMKPLIYTLFFIVLPAFFLPASAQSTLEFANGSGPATSGSTVANQVITFQENVNNPLDNVFTPYTTPTTKVTFSLSNQQYTLLTSQNPNQASVSFGGYINTGGAAIGSFNQFTDMGAVSTPPSGDFSSSSFDIGTGIATASDYATEIFTSAMGLFNAGSATSGNYYMANLTISFSTPVTNPVIHIVGMGGTYGGLGFSSQLVLQTPGVSLSLLTGSTEMNVTSTQILNSAAAPASTTGSGAASGSIQVTGTGISMLVFKVYLRGDGVGSNWASIHEHVGDAWMIGVSLLVTDLVLPVAISSFTAKPQGHSALLQWSTATEENTEDFEVQYSKDGNSWSDIAEMRAAGTSVTQQNYQFVHNDPAAGANYYRLMEVDQDGRATYSAVREVSFASSVVLAYYPNPVRDRVTITMEDVSGGSFGGSSGNASGGGPGSVSLQSVAVMSVDGRQLQQNSAFVSGGSIDLSRYAAGVYFLAIRNTAGQVEVVKILKN